MAVYSLLFFEYLFYAVHHVDEVGILQSEIYFLVIVEPGFFTLEFVV